jgi:hypothetical protein
MATSSFGKSFLIAAGIGGLAGIIAGLGDRFEASKAAAAKKTKVSGSPYARPLAYLYGVWPLIKAGIAGRKSLEQAATVSRTLTNNDDFLRDARKEEVDFVVTLQAELGRRLAA